MRLHLPADFFLCVLCVSIGSHFTAGHQLCPLPYGWPSWTLIESYFSPAVISSVGWSRNYRAINLPTRTTTKTRTMDPTADLGLMILRQWFRENVYLFRRCQLPWSHCERGKVWMLFYLLTLDPLQKGSWRGSLFLRAFMYTTNDERISTNVLRKIEKNDDTPIRVNERTRKPEDMRCLQ